MQISEILAYLKNYNPRVLSANTDNGLLTKAETFTIDTDFKPEILYIGYESQVKDILRFLNGNTLFLLHDIEKTSIKNDYNNNIVFFPEKVNIDELLETCQRILSDQKKFYQQVYELTEAFLSLKPMQKIIDLIAQQIHNPVLMLDNSYRVLYTSQNIQCNDLQWNENVERLLYLRIYFQVLSDADDTCRKSTAYDRMFFQHAPPLYHPSLDRRQTNWIFVKY
jgi:hypothetical protein